MKQQKACIRDGRHCTISKIRFNHKLRHVKNTCRRFMHNNAKIRVNYKLRHVKNTCHRFLNDLRHVKKCFTYRGECDFHRWVCVKITLLILHVIINSIIEIILEDFFKILKVVSNNFFFMSQHIFIKRAPLKVTPISRANGCSRWAA